MITQCACGCGTPVRGSYLVKAGVWVTRRYIVGHFPKVQPRLDQAYRWKGGRRKSHGYVEIKKPEHPFADSEGYVKEHRLIMEAELGRYLATKEYVHHINGVKTDNRIENLQLINPSKHSIIHHIIDMSDRVCSDCGSNKTTIKKENGRPHWNHWNKRLVCNTCYQKLYRRNGCHILEV